MKCKNIFVAILMTFGLVSIIDASLWFGREALDMSANRLFFHSLWVFVRNIIAFSTLFMSFPFLLGKFSRYVLVFIWSYIVLVESAMIYAEKVFHASLQSVWLEILGNTSPDEVLKFIQMSVGVKLVALVSFLIIIWIGGCWILWRATYPKLSRKGCLLGGVGLLPFILLQCVFLNWHWGMAQMHYTDFIIGTIKSWRSMRGINDACNRPNLPKALDCHVLSKNLPDVFFVLGESSTRNNWHLYGYERKTTPMVDKLYKEGSLFYFTDVVGSQPDTSTALSLLLTDVELESRQLGHWTLAEVYKRAGYKCVLISNQYFGETSLLHYIKFSMDVKKD